MSKSSTARSRLAGTAPTPEELADENRRTKEARRAPSDEKVLTYEQVQAGPPAADPAFVAAVGEWRQYEDHGELLRQGRWVPSTPAEFAAALWALAGDIDCVWDRHSVPSIPTLEEHILAIESVITGKKVEWIANLEEDPTGAGPTRIPFQVLYQQFEGQRKAGEDAGLVQRIEDLERRLAALEKRLDPDNDYSQSDGDEPNALDGLWLASHNADGTRSGPTGAQEAEPMTDLTRGHLRPMTWAQVCDCLGVLANSTSSLLTDVMGLEDARGPMQELVANLSRAVMSSSPRSAHDIAEAFVLETVTRQLVNRREEEAEKLQAMWGFIEAWSQDRYNELGQSSWRMVLVPSKGNEIEDGDLIIRRKEGTD